MQSKNPPISMLLVEDSNDDVEALKRICLSDDREWKITHFVRAEDALQTLTNGDNSYDVAVTDYNLPGINGLDFCKKVLALDIKIPLVMLTGTGSEEIAAEALRLGVTDYAIKDTLSGYVKLLPETMANAISRFNDHQQLIHSEKRFRVLFDNSPVMYFTVDSEGMILAVNHMGAQTLGYAIDELVGSSLLVLSHEEDRHKAGTFLQECIAQPLKSHSCKLRKLRKDESVIWVNDTARCIKNYDGKTAILIVSEDITEARLLEDQLVFQASHDSLTGLVNRQEFERRAERLISTLQKGRGEHAMCFMDLDQFKVVNDTCGHIAGDEMLRQIAELLQIVVRRRDTLARLGGDEFGVLMEHCSLEQAQRVADTLLRKLEDFQFFWEGQSFRIGVSIGLVAITETTVNLTELLRQADAACYMAKDLGRNRIHVYRPEDTELAQRHGEMQWVARINQALEDNLFTLFAQRIIPLGEGNEKHYELLVRMLDENGDTIPPGAFLPAAERYDLIGQLDTWVIERAFTLMAAHPAFVEQVNFISINLSGQSIADSKFLDSVVALIDKSGVDASKICFEITETAAISNLNAATKFISVLRDLGCRFALDDFGSGLSSFGYLKNLPVDYLKIDGIFVKGIVDDPIDHAMVKSINEIGHVMGIKTIAEFVENDEIKARLTEIGVDYAQGYGIGKPEPFTNILEQSSQNNNN